MGKDKKDARRGVFLSFCRNPSTLRCVLVDWTDPYGMTKKAYIEQLRKNMPWCEIKF